MFFLKRTDYAIPGADGLQLHHFYRAMAWLGEETAPIADGALAPRCIKDVIEEQLFERRRDLFSELSVVFMDTTTLSFAGEGGETLGAHGHSKDHRPDLKQMVLAVVLDGEGRPLCTEMLPGNTADVTVLLPVVDRLRQRFAVGRVCVVADRGMISTATIRALEERGLEYILGARERSSAVIREVVLNDAAPFTPLLIERARGETQLFVKEVKVDGARYIVCRNEAEAEKDRADRQAIVDGLEKQLRKGDKALIGNSAYRRYLRRVRDEDGPGGPAFEIDAGKLAEEAATTASSCCAPTPGSPRCRRCCATAICCRSRTCSAAPRRSCAPGRSIIPPMPPSAATCSARSWRCAAEGARRPLPGRRPHRRMGRPAARSRPPAGGHHRQGRQAHHHPHPRHRPGRPRLPGRRHRAATQHPRTPDLTPCPRNVVLTTGPAGVTNCY